jgi:hypothetical protein
MTDFTYVGVYGYRDKSVFLFLAPWYTLPLIFMIGWGVIGVFWARDPVTPIDQFMLHPEKWSDLQRGWILTFGGFAGLVTTLYVFCMLSLIIENLSKWLRPAKTPVETTTIKLDPAHGDETP